MKTAIQLPKFKEKIKQTCLSKYGVDHPWKSEEVKNHIKQTNMKKYGGSAPTCNSKVQEKRIETFRKRKINYPKPLHYLYENTSFDSSWELAVWIWAKDNGFEIEREPITLMYKARDRIRYYLPDFKLNNNLIEVKGDQFFNEQNQIINLYNRQNDDIALAKQDCMLINNVQIWKFKELKPILEYITKEYGEKHLENFRIKKSF